MNYGKKVMEIVEAHVANMEDLDTQGRKLEQQFRAELITGKVYNERLKEIEDKRAAALTDAQQKIQELHQQHDAAVDAWNALDGSKLHPDAELLKLDLPMSQMQYQQLASKHKDNSLMLSLLAQYADRHPDEPLFADRPVDATARKSEFADFCERASGCIRNHDTLSAALFLSGNSVPKSVYYEY